MIADNDDRFPGQLAPYVQRVRQGLIRTHESCSNDDSEKQRRGFCLSPQKYVFLYFLLSLSRLIGRALNGQ